MTLDEYSIECFALSLRLEPGSSGEYLMKCQAYAKGSTIPVVPMSSGSAISRMIK